MEELAREHLSHAQPHCIIAVLFELAFENFEEEAAELLGILLDEGLFLGPAKRLDELLRGDSLGVVGHFVEEDL